MDAFLNKDELSVLTGYSNFSSQSKWLDNNGWIYHLNAKGFPVVGREYCNAKMSGGRYENSLIGEMPDFSKVNNGRY